MRNIRLAVVLFLPCFSLEVCLGQDVSRNDYQRAVIGAFGGLGDTPQKTAPDLTGGTWAVGTHSFAYSITYRQELRRRLSGSFTYVNQGHYDRHGFRTSHHSRDDAQVELLFAQRPFGGPVEFRIGGGPAYYSETEKTGDGAASFHNRQSFGLALSGMVDIDVARRVFIELQAHRHLVLNRYPSTNALVGVGYRWMRDDAEIGLAERRSEQFVRINYGVGTLNSARSESLRDSFQVAHEIDMSENFGTAVSYLREGSAPELNRQGLAIQAIARQDVGGVVTLGFGLGPYINADRSDFFERRNRISVDALFTAFLDFSVTDRVALSASTSRPRSLTTLRNKPMTDVYHLGLKFRLR